jgi:hypothetical protein
MSTAPDNAGEPATQARIRRFGIPTIYADALAYASLVFPAAFWIEFALGLIPHARPLPVTGPQMLAMMSVPVVLGALSALLGSKLWKAALAASLAMLFFVMYVNGV